MAATRRRVERPPRRRAAPRAGEALDLGVLGQVLGFHLAMAGVATGRAFEQSIGEPFGLRQVEFSLLMLALANGPQTPKRLGQALAMSAPMLSMRVDRLQERGLVRREPSPTDGRSQHIVLTDAGLALARDSAAAAGPMEERLGEGLSPAERLMLIELLGKVGRR